MNSKSLPQESVIPSTFPSITETSEVRSADGGETKRAEYNKYV